VSSVHIYDTVSVKKLFFIFVLFNNTNKMYFVAKFLESNSTHKVLFQKSELNLIFIKIKYNSDLIKKDYFL